VLVYTIFIDVDLKKTLLRGTPNPRTDGQDHPKVLAMETTIQRCYDQSQWLQI